MEDDELHPKVKNLLEELGYIQHTEGCSLGSSLEKHYTQNQQIGVDIFDSPFICDFLVTKPDSKQLGILVKWLKEPEEDEIFPYLVESISALPDVTFAIVVGGAGCSPDAKSWLETNSSEQKNILGAFYIKELESYLKTIL